MKHGVLFTLSILVAGQFLLLGVFVEGEDLPREKTLVDDVLTYEQIVLIPPGEDFTVRFDPDMMQLLPKREPQLEPVCMQALGLVPDWMRINLTHKFRLLSSEDRQLFAGLIVNSPDEKYIDEIGFVIAHSTPQTLTDPNFFPEIITHNAELIYEHDEYLNYVEIVEKDDHTTLAYLQADNTTVEIDRETYYWYVVHPKIGDELPTYVDPDYNYTQDPRQDRNKGAQPPVGKYWRDWFFVYNKTGKPLLKDSLQNMNTTLDAIKAINGWMSKSMKFTSDNERPVQPVRIYVKGKGRCGEYQDIRSATARAALIPVIATSNAAEDHVWNEFWDLGWHHWDGMIDNPHAYEKGWGKTISSVWNSRGDGYSWSVTSTYSDVSTFDVTVVDLNNLPVDGADIDVYTENFYQPEIRTVTYSDVTHTDGTVSFELGDMRNFWGRTDTTDLGSDPIAPLNQNEMALNTTAGEEYAIAFQLSQAAPRLNIIEPQGGNRPPGPHGTLSDPIFGVDFEVVGSITRGNSRVALGRFDLYQEGGMVDFFLADDTNMRAYEAGTPAVGYNFEERTNGTQVYPHVPTDSEWTYVISNGYSQQTYKIVKIRVIVRDELTLRIDTPVDGQKVSVQDTFEISGIIISDATESEVEVNLGGDRWNRIRAQSNGTGELRWTTHVAISFPEGYGLTGLPMKIDIMARIPDSNESVVGTWIELVDETPPEFLSLNIDDPTVKAGGMITVSGSLFDNVGVASMEFSVDGSDQMHSIEMTNDNHDFQFDLSTSNLDFGMHQVHLFATDHYDNVGKSILDFEVVESIKPVVEIHSPHDGDVLKYGEPVLIEGRVRDNSAISEIKVSFDNYRTEETIELTELDSKGYFIFELDYSSSYVQPGYETITLYAMDIAENFDSKSIDIFLDGTEPTIEMDHPRRMIVGGNSDVEISGTIDDDVDIGNFEMMVNNGPWEEARFSSSSGSFSIELDTSFDLKEGDNEIILRVTDVVGWEVEEELIITVDGTSPTVEFDTIPEYVMKGEMVNIRVIIEETYEIEEIIMTVEGVGTSDITEDLDVAEVVLSIDSSEMRPGMADITIKAMDQAGNIGDGRISVHVITDTLDTDGDNVPDWWEYKYRMDPFSFDSDQDPDGDGYTNLEEFLGDDGEWGEQDDSTDPRSSLSTPYKKSSRGPVVAIIVIVVMALIVLVIALLGFILTRRKL